MDNNRTAVFIDRDGTLIEDIGVLTHPVQIRLLPEAIDALRILHKKHLLFIVSNQPGISRGDVTKEQVALINHTLDDLFRKNGVHITEWYICPHERSEGCHCIKPNPYFLIEAAKKYSLNLQRSFMIGDHPHDVLTGDTVGVFGLYLLSGHGFSHLDELSEERLIFHTIGQAAAWIDLHPHSQDDFLSEIKLGAAAIRKGDLTAFPTETVYGLGADAFNAAAVARIYEVKRRPLHNPLIVHIADVEQVELLATQVSDQARTLMEKFWPGPLTLVLTKSSSVPEIVTAGNPTVAIRMPANPWTRQLIRLSETPIAAPSANAFGRTSPTTAAHVREQLSGSYDVLIDGGACRVGMESTVLSVYGKNPILLRHGGICKTDIETLIGHVLSFEQNISDIKKLESPGMMASHYAPDTPLHIVDDVRQFAKRPDVGILLFERKAEIFSGPVETLSPAGNLREAAVNLYSCLRKLDGMKLSLIVVERLPETGLGVAINDRLTKAAAPFVSE